MGNGQSAIVVLDVTLKKKAFLDVAVQICISIARQH
jgi:hypothetical protein